MSSPTTSPFTSSSPTDLVMVGRDLIFTSKVIGTARALGFAGVTAAGPQRGLELIRQHAPRLVVLDLTCPEVDHPETLAALAAAALPSARVVAFGPHVEGDLLRSALRAGCDPVLPRSRFTARLPEWLVEWLGTPRSTPDANPTHASPS